MGRFNLVPRNLAVPVGVNLVEVAREPGYSLPGFVAGKRIARVHDGAIRLLPRDGGGLEASVELPL